MSTQAGPSRRNRVRRHPAPMLGGGPGGEALHVRDHPFSRRPERNSNTAAVRFSPWTTPIFGGQLDTTFIELPFLPLFTNYVTTLSNLYMYRHDFTCMLSTFSLLSSARHHCKFITVTLITSLSHTYVLSIVALILSIEFEGERLQAQPSYTLADA